MDINWGNVWGVAGSYIMMLGIIVIGLLLYLGVYLLAQRDILLGFVPQGQIKAIMRGASLRRILINIGGYYYDMSTREIKMIEVGKPTPREPRSFLGMYWIGLPPFWRVLKYKFSWVKWDKGEGSDEFALISRDREDVNSLLFRYPYGIEVKKINMAGLAEVDIILVVTIEIARPETTLFRLQPTGNWLGLVVAKVAEATRGYAGEANVTIETLRALKAREAGAENDLRTRIMQMNGEATPAVGSEPAKEEAEDGILRLCGVKIVSVEFQNFKFSDQSVGEAFRKRELEERIAAGVIAKARGEATALLKRGNAEATVVRRKRAAAGQDNNLVARIAEAEALSKTNVRVLTIGGQPPINTVPVTGLGSITDEP